MCLKYLITFFLFIQLTHLYALPTIKSTNEKFLNPVILTPGIAGSQLVAKLNRPEVLHYYCQKTTDEYFNIWLSLNLIIPVAINCWVDNMILKYDNKTRKTYNQDGVDIKVTEFGNTSTIEYINPSKIRYTVYFDPIVKSLESHGYEIGLNLFGTPYDFRKSPAELDDFYAGLDKIILSSYRNNGKMPVILVCHSMGCLMLYMHLDKKPQEFKDKYIKSLITLGAPWGGSVKSVKEIVSGDNLGISFVDETSIRDISRTFPSVLFLFPKPGFWREDEPFLTVATNENRNLTYTSSDYEELFKDLKLPDTLEIYKDVSKLMTNWKAPNIEVHCFHGFGLDTPKKLHFSQGKFPDGNPLVEMGEGDGTVNIRSLEYCKYWKGRQSQEVTYQTFHKVEHMATVSDLNVVKKVTEVITGIKFTKLEDLFNNDHYFDPTLKFSLNLNVSDLKTEKNSKLNLSEIRMANLNKSKTNKNN